MLEASCWDFRVGVRSTIFTKTFIYIKNINLYKVQLYFQSYNNFYDKIFITKLLKNNNFKIYLIDLALNRSRIINITTINSNIQIFLKKNFVIDDHYCLNE